MRRNGSLLCLCFLAVLWSGCKNTSASAKNDAPPDIPPPASASAAPSEPAGAGFRSSGTAAAVRTSQLAAKASGVLRSIKVREGERVKAGQVLCVLDAVNASLRSEAAIADHAQAIAALQDAKRDLDRAEQLADAGALPDQAMDKTKLAMRIAKLRADAASVGVRMAQQSLADATVRAPFDGVITKVLSEEGQYVTVMPPSPVFVLVDTSALEVRVHVPERKISQIEVGQPVRVELPAVDETREAKIDRMADVIDSVTRSAEVIILLDNKDHALPAGLFARVIFPSITQDSSDGDPSPSQVTGQDAPAEGGR